MGIAFDLDETLAESSGGMLHNVAQLLGVSDTSLTLTESYLMPVGPRDGDWDERTRQLVQAFISATWHDEAFNAGLRPIGTGPQLLHELDGAGLLRGYVTRRPSILRGVSEQWLRRCGFPARALLHAASSPRVCKSSGMTLLGAQVLVDDHPEEVGSVTRLQARQLGSVLISRPHNRQARPSGTWAYRAGTLEEAAHTATAMLALLRR